MKQILRYLIPYKKQITIGLIVKSIGTFAELLIPMILAYVLDTVIPTQQLASIILFGFLMIACSFAGLFSNMYVNRHAAKISTDAIQEVRNDAYERILYFTNQNIDHFKIPSLISRMTTDTYHIYRMFNVIQRIAVRATIILFGSLLIMITLDTFLAMVLIGLLPLMAVAVYFISRNSIPLYENLQTGLDDMIRIVRERIGGIRVIKALSKEQEEKTNFTFINDEVSKREQKAGILISALNPLMNVILNLGLVLIIYIGIDRVSSGLSKTGSIIAFLSYFTQILNAFMAINRIFMLYSKASASAIRITDILNTENDISFIEDNNSSDTYTIEFDHVSFSYTDNEKQHIDQISFQIKPNETFGIIGSTGSGKSTIAQLLLRFYDVSHGTIRIHGKDIKSYSLHDLRHKFGVVLQNDVLFTDTVTNNIRFGREMEMDDVVEAASAAQARDFIEMLTHGYDEQVQRSGANFSGGQRQRMLIARALAHDPDILILDDASSALDYRTDATLRQSLKNKKATLIYIAQRISTVMQADQILVLDEGEIVGLGRHEELLANCQAYQELYEIQLGGGL